MCPYTKNHRVCRRPELVAENAARPVRTLHKCLGNEGTEYMFKYPDSKLFMEELSGGKFAGSRQVAS